MKVMSKLPREKLATDPTQAPGAPRMAAQDQWEPGTIDAGLKKIKIHDFKIEPTFLVCIRVVLFYLLGSEPKIPHLPGKCSAT